MAIAEDIRAVVEDLFVQFASTITITPEASESIDDWGEPVTVDDTTFSATGIIDSYNQFVKYFTNGRPIGGADVVFIMKTDNVISSTDTITYKTVDYSISNINPIPVSDTDIVYIINASIK